MSTPSCPEEATSGRKLIEINSGDMVRFARSGGEFNRN
jgi:hypothetical protein